MLFEQSIQENTLAFFHDFVKTCLLNVLWYI